MKINEFVMSFEKNMNVLLSLTHFFEEKSLFEVAKIKAKVLELLNNDKVDPNVKFDIINKNLRDLTEIILNIFKNIGDKVSEYETVSQGKIARYKHYFFQNFRKFFENTQIK
jgi:F0F1-type ATP synthase gamma subunit